MNDWSWSIDWLIDCLIDWFFSFQLLAPLSDNDQMEFLCNLFRDGVELANTPRLAVMLYFDKPDKARILVFFIVQKIIDMSCSQQENGSGGLLSKKERDREAQIKAYLNGLVEMAKCGMQYIHRLMGGTNGSPEEREELDLLGVPMYLDYLLMRMDSLLICSPVLTCQWIAESARSMDALRIWAINQLELVMDIGLGLGRPVGVGRSFFIFSIQKQSINQSVNQ